MADISKMVRALKGAGEMTRLRLLALLAAGEMSVRDLTAILGQSQPRVSRHLKLLNEAGLVTRNSEGAWVYYRLVDFGEAGALVQTILTQFDAEDDIIRADQKALVKAQLANQAQADAYFADVASGWDDLRKLHVSEHEVEEAILRLVGSQKVEHLLDLGTGTGRMLELLAEKYSFGVGIDSSREMIAFARSKLAGAKITHAQVKLGDICVPVSGEVDADLIILHQVLHFFADPGQVLREASRRLAAGGRILVVDFAPHDLEFLRERHAHRRLGLSEEQIGAWAMAAGLKPITYEHYSSDSQPEGLGVCLWLFTKIQGAE